MARKVRPEDLSEEQLKHLLVKKRLAARKRRLKRFRESGRLVEDVPPPEPKAAPTFGGIVLEEPEKGEEEQAEPGKRKGKTTIDRLLLGIEIVAIVGLMFVLLNSVGLWRRLNTEVAAALQQNTLTPTPLFDLVVLPSGHTPPTAPGGAQFNMSEIPEHLQPVVQSYYENLAIPTPSPEQAVRIEIPAIEVAAPVVQGDGWEQLKQGVGQHIGTANPGQQGNLVLSAHNDVFGEIFRHLDKLQPGDTITVFTNIRSYTYVVQSEPQVVDPTYVEAISPTVDPTVTLISCYPYLVNDQRIVVKAALADS